MGLHASTILQNAILSAFLLFLTKVSDSSGGFAHTGWAKIPCAPARRVVNL